MSAIPIREWGLDAEMPQAIGCVEKWSCSVTRKMDEVDGNSQTLYKIVLVSGREMGHDASDISWKRMRRSSSLKLEERLFLGPGRGVRATLYRRVESKTSPATEDAAGGRP